MHGGIRLSVTRSIENVASGLVQEQVMHGGIQIKRSFVIRESLNISEQVALAKQRVIDRSHESNDNNLNPTPPQLPHVQQVQQLIQACNHYANPYNGVALTPQAHAQVGRKSIKGLMHFNP